MSQTMKWLDFSSYGMKLVIGRDRTEKKNHTVLFAGPGLQNPQTLKILTDLGFTRDARFPNKQYWTRSYIGFRLTDLRAQFPNSTVVDLPVEEISPAAKFELKQRQVAGVNNESATEQRSRPTGITAGNAAGSLNDGGAGANGVLGQNPSRPDVRDQPAVDADPARGGNAEQLSQRAGGTFDRQGEVAGEGLPTPVPIGAVGDAPDASTVAQPGEVIRGGNVAERPEPADAVAARGTAGNSEALTQPQDSLQPVSAQQQPDEAPEPAAELEPDPEAVTSEGFNQQEYDAARQSYGSGPNAAAGDENAFDEAIAPVEPKPVAEASPQLGEDQDSDNFLDTKEAFDRRDYDAAYALYQQGMSGNGVERDAFEDALAGMSGGRAASLYLSQDQRRELHRMGMRDNIVEHFATHYTGDCRRTDRPRPPWASDKNHVAHPTREAVRIAGHHWNAPGTANAPDAATCSMTLSAV